MATSGRSTTRTRGIYVPPVHSWYKQIDRDMVGPLTALGGGSRIDREYPPTYQYRSYLTHKVGRQITVSEGHPWPPVRGKFKDIGGAFSTTKSYVDPGDCIIPQRLVRTWYQYVRTTPLLWGSRWAEALTPVFPISPTDSRCVFPTHTASSDEELAKYGAEAVARCKPTNSAADLSVALGELVKEGLPSIIGLRSLTSGHSMPKKASDEFLNIEFGWKPLLSDVKKLAQAVINADKLIRQYERDAGRLVRRSYVFPTERSFQTQVIQEQVHPIGNFAQIIVGNPTGRLVRTVETVQKRWFKGAFTYHLPRDFKGRKELADVLPLARHVLGLELTPEVLWNLSPWSWLVDWFTNAGDVISNISDAANDGLVMRYGYMMEHTITKTTFELLDYRFVFSSTGGRVPPYSLVFETKRRVRANPFGFGLNDEDLTPRQWTILAALGISRGS